VQQIGEFADIGQGIEISIVEWGAFGVSSPDLTQEFILVVIECG
jgi:hypothetical protein